MGGGGCKPRRPSALRARADMYFCYACARSATWLLRRSASGEVLNRAGDLFVICFTGWRGGWGRVCFSRGDLGTAEDSVHRDRFVTWRFVT